MHMHDACACVCVGVYVCVRACVRTCMYVGIQALSCNDSHDHNMAPAARAGMLTAPNAAWHAVRRGMRSKRDANGPACRVLARLMPHMRASAEHAAASSHHSWPRLQADIAPPSGCTTGTRCREPWAGPGQRTRHAVPCESFYSGGGGGRQRVQVGDEGRGLAGRGCRLQCEGHTCDKKTSSGV